MMKKCCLFDYFSTMIIDCIYSDVMILVRSQKMLFIAHNDKGGWAVSIGYHFWSKTIDVFTLILSPFHTK